MNTYIALFLSCALVLSEASANNVPPSVTVNLYHAPNAVVAFNKAYLLYELYLSNYMPTTMTLNSIDTKDKTWHLTSTQKDLAQAIQTFNPQSKNKPFLFQPGESKIIYFMFPFENLPKVPEQLKQVFHFADQQGKKYELDYPKLMINKKPPVIIAAPLGGSNWLAANGLSNESAHRRAGLYFYGRPYYPERYAIDFLKMDPTGETYLGDENKNTSYLAYNQDVLAVANAKVVAIKDGLAENIPHSGKLAVELNADTIAGNYIILELEKGVYAGYAHLIPGSIKVKPGDLVKRGQVIAKLGNSGNSGEPHLHLQLMDAPTIVAANPVAYGFDRFSVIPSKLEVSGENIRVKVLQGTAIQYLNQLPLDQALVNWGND